MRRSKYIGKKFEKRRLEKAIKDALNGMLYKNEPVMKIIRRGNFLLNLRLEFRRGKNISARAFIKNTEREKPKVHYEIIDEKNKLLVVAYVPESLASDMEALALENRLLLKFPKVKNLEYEIKLPSKIKPETLKMQFKNNVLEIELEKASFQ